MATIHDVALDAGVSPTTVSRYVNNRIELPAATCARIDAAIRKLDYRPNILARRLSTGKTEAIGLVAPELRDPFFSELVTAVEDEADRHGYTIFISSTRSDRQREIAAINRLHDRHVDGLIMMTSRRDDGILAELIGRQRHVVLIDEDVPGVDVPRVFVDNERGAYDGTRHLIEMGHREIGFLGGPRGLLSTDERLAGYLRALGESGISVRNELVQVGSYDADFGQVAVFAMLAGQRRPTAIFASSNSLALAAVAALHRAGVLIPDEMSLVGFDDPPVAELLEPPLTAIRQPIDALGRQGFLALLSLLGGGEPPAMTRLPVTLIRRGSVASPRRAPHRRAAMSARV